jgi:hypothetical protein
MHKPALLFENWLIIKETKCRSTVVNNGINIGNNHKIHAFAAGYLLLSVYIHIYIYI